MGFRGTVPRVPCGQLSGEACAELVRADDESCALGHRLPTRELPPVPEGVATGLGRRRPALAGREQVQFVTLEDEEAVVSRLALSADDLRVSRRALNECAEHHRIDEDRARAEMRLLVTSAARTGAIRRLQSGYWLVDHEKFAMRLDPSAQVIVSYGTRHYERTPSEVLGGAPSRFGRQKRPPRVPGVVLPLDELKGRLATDPELSERLVSVWARRRKISNEEASAELAAELRADALSGAWTEADPPGTWLLFGTDRVWRIAADAPLALATWAADSN
jgi:hypothetical protein